MNNNGSGHLSPAEFERGMQRLERFINTRFDSVDERLALFEEKHANHGERIAKLEARASLTRKHQVSWGAAAAGAITLALEGIRRLLGGA